jgi:hypothetical protein
MPVPLASSVGGFGGSHNFFAVCPNMLTANSTPVLHELTVTKKIGIA